jgi:OFA family oxalate/formate antiporter-like MFS transporter
VRRWVTLVASTVASMCCGFFYAWSVLAKPMMQTHGWTSAEVALGFTIVVAIPALCTLLAGKLQQYIRPPTLLFISGTILGLGTILLSFATSLGLLYTFAFIAGVGGMTYPGATMANLMRFFPDKRGLAAGVLTAGFGLGAVIWGPVTVLLIDHLGFVWTLRLLGLVFAVVIAICSRLVTVAPAGYAPRGWEPQRTNVSSGPSESVSWKTMLRTPSFWLLAVVFVLGLISGMMVTAHVSPIAQQKLGISPAAAGAFVSYLALGMVAGKVGWGALSDRISRGAVLLTVLAISVAALLLLWQTDSYALVVIGMFAVGLCYGGFLALIGPVTLEAFGPKGFAVNFGIMYLTMAVASYAGPRLAAAVAEADGGAYKRAFLVAAALTAAGLLFAGVRIWLARRGSSARPGSPGGL